MSFIELQYRIVPPPSSDLQLQCVSPNGNEENSDDSLTPMYHFQQTGVNKVNFEVPYSHTFFSEKSVNGCPRQLNVYLLGSDKCEELFLKYSSSVTRIDFFGCFNDPEVCFRICTQLKSLKEIRFDVCGSKILDNGPEPNTTASWCGLKNTQITSLSIIASSVNLGNLSSRCQEMINKYVEILLEYSKDQFPNLAKLSLELPDTDTILTLARSFLRSTNFNRPYISIKLDDCIKVTYETSLESQTRLNPAQSDPERSSIKKATFPGHDSNVNGHNSSKSKPQNSANALPANISKLPPKSSAINTPHNSTSTPSIKVPKLSPNTLANNYLQNTPNASMNTGPQNSTTAPAHNAAQNSTTVPARANNVRRNSATPANNVSQSSTTVPASANNVRRNSTTPANNAAQNSTTVPASANNVRRNSTTPANNAAQNSTTVPASANNVRRNSTTPTNNVPQNSANTANKISQNSTTTPANNVPKKSANAPSNNVPEQPSTAFVKNAPQHPKTTPVNNVARNSTNVPANNSPQNPTTSANNNSRKSSTSSSISSNQTVQPLSTSTFDTTKFYSYSMSTTERLLRESAQQMDRKNAEIAQRNESRANMEAEKDAEARKLNSNGYSVEKADYDSSELPDPHNTTQRNTPNGRSPEPNPKAINEHSNSPGVSHGQSVRSRSASTDEPDIIPRNKFMRERDVHHRRFQEDHRQEMRHSDSRSRSRSRDRDSSPTRSPDRRRRRGETYSPERGQYSEYSHSHYSSRSFKHHSRGRRGHRNPNRIFRGGSFKRERGDGFRGYRSGY